jgi:hypothetical protein
MNIIKTIDLWTEQHDNHYECFNGAFVDGFENNKIPFNEYKIIKNCNCVITVNNQEININNKHNALVFYKDNVPVRLMVMNKNTDIDKCIVVALSQHFNNSNLKDYYDENSIKFKIIDMNEQPIFKDTDNTKPETDVGSCDRWNLLYCMLKGSYTEDDTCYGNFQSDRYEFIPDIFIKYELKTDTEKFEIVHKCAFINTIKTRLIPIQENSLLTKQD